MKFYLGVTNNNWFNYLSRINPEDVNFWQPGGTVNFKVLTSGAPFLFKIRSPMNAIGGIGFFSSHTFLPITIVISKPKRLPCNHKQTTKTLTN